jgi:hypothetical protein
METLVLSLFLAEIGSILYLELDGMGVNYLKTRLLIYPSLFCSIPLAWFTGEILKTHPTIAN